MKKRILFIVALILSLNLIQAQTTVVSNLDLPLGIIVIEDNLYIGCAGPAGIFKANLTSIPTTATLFIPNIYECNGFAVQGNDLYIGDLAGNNIYKTDLTVSPPVASIFAGPFYSTIGLAIKDDFLYFSTGFGNQLMKIDVTDPTPNAEMILTGSDMAINGIILDGNDLYYCEYSDILGQSAVVKIDITNSNPSPTTIAAGFGSQLRGIAKYGSNIYVAERSLNRIKKIDLANGNAVSNFLSLDSPNNLAVAGSDLYISQPFEGTIVKVSLTPLSVEDFELQNKIAIVPNPSTDFINISGLVRNSEYVIYDISGKLIKRGHIDLDELINVERLESGLYFIKLDSDLTSKFVKN